MERKHGVVLAAYVVLAKYAELVHNVIRQSFHQVAKLIYAFPAEVKECVEITLLTTPPILKQQI
jgi:hypothetical protein